MSTTFEVYLSSDTIPSFKKVAKACEHNYWKYLSSNGISERPKISYRLLTKENNKEKPFDEEAPFIWDDDKYLWVQVENIEGGTDCYTEKTNESDREYWNEDIIPLDRSKPIKELLKKCIKQKHHWCFRRSAGQPAAINILYGILAGSLAKMEKGVVFSDDSAWDYTQMPIEGDKFLERYMIPEKELDPELKNWAADNIKQIKSELREKHA